MRGCGRIERPAFPAPSDVQKANVDGKTRAKTRGEIVKSCLDVIASKATKQSISRHHWIASRSLSSGAHSRDPLARNDGQGCGCLKN
jgi:hypothetical protein